MHDCRNVIQKHFVVLCKRGHVASFNNEVKKWPFEKGCTQALGSLAVFKKSNIYSAHSSQLSTYTVPTTITFARVLVLPFFGLCMWVVCFSVLGEGI